MTAVAEEMRLTLEPLPGIEWSATHLRITDPEFTYEMYEQMVAGLGGFGDSVRWWIGDALNIGQLLFGDEHDQVLDLTRLSERSLTRCRYVAEKVDPLRRRKNLTFSHHAEVASAEPDVQVKLLERAEREDLSVMALREIAQSEKRLQKLVRPRQEVLGAVPVVDSVAGLGAVRETIRLAHGHLSGDVDAVIVAQSLGPALSALDKASKTVAACTQVLDLRDLARELLSLAEPTADPAFLRVPKANIDQIAALVLDTKGAT